MQNAVVKLPYDSGIVYKLPTFFSANSLKVTIHRVEVLTEIFPA